MSTLSVSNISDGTTTVGTGYVVNGSAKAWVNFNGTGTIAARDSFNAASLTDNGTGDYTVNFTNAMANVNFSSAATCSGDGGAQLRCATALQALYAVGSCRFQTTSANVALADVNGVYVSIHGDLA
jgi:hypothetical protein